MCKKMGSIVEQSSWYTDILNGVKRKKRSPKGTPLSFLLLTVKRIISNHDYAM